MLCDTAITNLTLVFEITKEDYPKMIQNLDSTAEFINFRNNVSKNGSNMKWRTEIENVKTGLRINPERGILLTGSCFADYMASRMRAGLWNAQNPFGVLFNPLSIAEALRIAFLSESPESDYNRSIFESDGKYLSWLSEGSLRCATREDAIDNLMDKRRNARNLLLTGQTLCVTFGTAWCYFLKDGSRRVVANCHKQPQSRFDRRRISVEEICDKWFPIVSQIKELYRDLKILFTISPVRHVRDGLHDNTLSKAILHLAADRICSKFNYCSYFPAYEIVIDDLRDYRFYADDLVHPSDTAVEYIWEVFRKSFLDAEGENMLKQGEEITRRLSHRPLFPDSPEALSFALKTKEMYTRFRTEYPDSLEILI